MTKPEDLISFSIVGYGISHRDGDLGVNWDVIFKGGDITGEKQSEALTKARILCAEMPLSWYRAGLHDA